MKCAPLLVPALALAGPALAAPYAFAPVTSPTGTFRATALNDLGQFAGFFQPERPDSAPVGYGALAILDRGTVAALGAPYYGGFFAYAPYGLNDAGLLVGKSGPYFPQAFAYQNGREVELAVPYSLEAAAHDANNLGQIVGDYQTYPGRDPYSVPHGFLISDGVLTHIDVPGGRNTSARGINDLGQIVGDYDTARGSRAGFLLSGGTFSPIEVPGARDTVPVAINDAGQVVGGYTTAGGTTRGFVLDGGVYSDITGPDGRDFLPLGLDDRGRILGRFEGGDAGYEAAPSYLATPSPAPGLVPEPATAALLAAGLAALAGLRRRG